MGCPSFAAKVPGEHGVGSMLPVEQALPAGQSVQSIALVRLVAFEYDPRRQGKGKLVPLGQ